MSSVSETLPRTGQQLLRQSSGQHVLLRGVSWSTYEQLCADIGDSHAAHLAYCDGVLEIMVLSFKHETLNRILASIAEIVAEELDIDLVNAGSTTFKRADMQRGSEADSCFYIQHAGDVRGKDSIDLAVDPAPDLVIEVDLTHPSLDKMPIYAALGVPELWRYDGTALTIYTLSGSAYQLQPASSALPNIDGQTITHFVERAQTTKRTEWLAQLRAWLREKP